MHHCWKQSSQILSCDTPQTLPWVPYCLQAWLEVAHFVLQTLSSKVILSESFILKRNMHLLLHQDYCITSLPSKQLLSLRPILWPNNPHFIRLGQSEVFMNVLVAFKSNLLASFPPHHFFVDLVSLWLDSECLFYCRSLWFRFWSELIPCVFCCSTLDLGIQSHQCHSWDAVTGIDY